MRALEWDQGHSRLISAGQDGVVCVWPVDGKQEPAPLKLHLHTASVDSVTYVADRDVLVSLDTSGKGAVWDLSMERKPVCTWRYRVYCI